MRCQALPFAGKASRQRLSRSKSSNTAEYLREQQPYKISLYRNWVQDVTALLDIQRVIFLFYRISINQSICVYSTAHMKQKRTLSWIINCVFVG